MAVEDWVLGLDPQIVLLQELWEMEIELHGWTKGYRVFEGVKGTGLGLGVLVASWLIESGKEAWVVHDDEDALLVALKSTMGAIEL